MELNMRIQKSLILDFDYESAQDSAVEDWKIDIERETFDKKNAKLENTLSNNNVASNNHLAQINESDELQGGNGGV